MGSKSDYIPVLAEPRSKREAAAHLARLGHLVRRVQRRTAHLRDKVADLVEEALRRAAPIEEEIKTRIRMLTDFATGHRDSLLGEGGKTVHLGTGTISWRTSPPALSYREEDEDRIIRRMRRHGLRRALKRKVVIDKRALLTALQQDSKLRSRFPDVTIEASETITLTPAGLDVRLTVEDGCAVELPGKMKRPVKEE